MKSVPIAAAILFLAATAVQAQNTTEVSTFQCNVPVGHTCFFAIFDAAGGVTSQLTIPGGSRTLMLLPPREAETYVVTIDKNFTDDRTCHTANSFGVFCKHAVVIRDFNN